MVFFKYNWGDVRRQLELIMWAKEHAFEIMLDELDCSKSWARVLSDKTFDEMIAIFKKSGFRHLSIKTDDYSIYGTGNRKECISACARFSGDAGVDYFIWLNIDMSLLSQMAFEFKLERM